MPKSRPDDQQQRAELLASRLRTLLDFAEAKRGSKVTYSEISDYLSEAGLALSRARWSYMTNGHRLVDDLDLLDAISAYFDVPPGYLRGEANLPEKIAAELDLVRAMRDAEVRTIATRLYGELSPGTLNAIINILDQEAAERAGGA